MAQFARCDRAAATRARTCATSAATARSCSAPHTRASTFRGMGGLLGVSRNLGQGFCKAQVWGKAFRGGGVQEAAVHATAPRMLGRRTWRGQHAPVDVQAALRSLYGGTSGEQQHLRHSGVSAGSAAASDTSGWRMPLHAKLTSPTGSSSWVKPTRSLHNQEMMYCISYQPVRACMPSNCSRGCHLRAVLAACCFFLAGSPARSRDLRLPDMVPVALPRQCRACGIYICGWGPRRPCGAPPGAWPAAAGAAACLACRCACWVDFDRFQHVCVLPAFSGLCLAPVLACRRGV